MLPALHVPRAYLQTARRDRGLPGVAADHLFKSEGSIRRPDGGCQGECGMGNAPCLVYPDRLLIPAPHEVGVGAFPSTAALMWP